MSALRKNHCPESAGISVRFTQESLSGLGKNMHFNYTNKFELILENEKTYKMVPFFFVVDKNLLISFPYLADELAEFDELYFNKGHL